MICAIIAGINVVAYRHITQEDEFLEIRVLRDFLTVAREQSFTKAAEVLHITQTDLIAPIGRLGKRIGRDIIRS